MQNKHFRSVFYSTLGVTLMLGYFLFAWRLERSDFKVLISLYAFLFIGSYILYKKINSFALLFGIAIGFRLVAIAAIPNLSQDFYRFIWDGRLIIQGINPYLLTPEMYMADGNFVVNQAQLLIEGMGSLNASHFSNYPPINQLCFAWSAFWFNDSIIGSVISLRLLCILADVGILIVGSKLLKSVGLPNKRIFLYALNPFIIIELTGNLHFEGVMIFFLLLSLYFLQKQHFFKSSLSLAASVLTKLVPLLFFPVFLFHLNRFKNIKFLLLAGIVSVLGFAPFFSIQFITNYAKTVGLWFYNFEFNASIYYLIRKFGFYTEGYNIITFYGKWMAAIVFISVFIIAYKTRTFKTIQKTITVLISVLAIYFLLSTTVHPWYIATLVALSVFTTKFRFAFLWSALVILSYSAYSVTPFKENYWLIALQYIPVVTVFILDLSRMVKQAKTIEA